VLCHSSIYVLDVRLRGLCSICVVSIRVHRSALALLLPNMSLKRLLRSIGDDISDRMSERKSDIASKLRQLEQLMQQQNDDRDALDSLYDPRRRVRSRVETPGAEAMGARPVEALLDATVELQRRRTAPLACHRRPGHAAASNDTVEIRYLVLNNGVVIRNHREPVRASSSSQAP
jgi:hypothetical protein